MTSMRRHRVFSLALVSLAAVTLSGCSRNRDLRLDRADERMSSQMDASFETEEWLDDLDASLEELDSILRETDQWEIDLP